MKNFQLISQILSGVWCIDPKWVDTQMPLLASLFQATSDTIVPRSGNALNEKPFVVDPQTLERSELYLYNPASDSYILNTNIKDGCVGILPITGPITKYNVGCGPEGAQAKANYFQVLQSNPNISAIILLLDTPGGEARAAQPLADAIASSAKPVIAYVDGTCASLGMWFASAARETWMSNALGDIGSIGVMCSFPDYSEALEKEGIKIRTVYAPQSKDKNAISRDLDAGGDQWEKEIEADLALFANQFIEFVNQNNQLAAQHQEAWNSGKLFHAEEAIQVGLLNGVMTFNKVIARAAYLSTQNL